MRGATHALAFFGLAKAFAGIVTGNPSLVRPTVTVVVGEITWAWLLRRPAAATGLLIPELALFLLAAAAHRETLT